MQKQAWWPHLFIAVFECPIYGWHLWQVWKKCGWYIIFKWITLIDVCSRVSNYHLRKPSESKPWALGLFPFNKHSSLKFRKFHVSNGTVHSDCTDPTQATARLVIVLVSRIQKSGTEDNNFVKWKGTFWSDRPKCPDRSKWTIFNAGSSYVDILFQCHKPKTCLVWSILLYFILLLLFFKPLP